jgi:rhodanese-related sulfurtransferase
VGGPNLLEMFNLIQSRLGNIEKKLDAMEEKLELSVAIQRNQLIRVKNNEQISDEVILTGRPYNDLSPEKAYELYGKHDLDFVILDVSESDYKPERELPEAIKIPLEELAERCGELVNHTTPILVISEEGVRSILACELLIKRGYFNLNNVSGGYRFWPGFRLKQVKEISA